MKYIIVSEYDMGEFIQRVNELLKEGWIPQGGITHLKTIHPDSIERFRKDEYDSSIKRVVLFMQPMILVTPH